MSLYAPGWSVTITTATGSGGLLHRLGPWRVWPLLAGEGADYEFAAGHNVNRLGTVCELHGTDHRQIYETGQTGPNAYASWKAHHGRDAANVGLFQRLITCRRCLSSQRSSNVTP